MSAEVFWIISSLVILIINITTMLITFPCRYSLRTTIGILIAYTTVLYSIVFIAGNPLVPYGNLRGIVYLPLMIWLVNSQVLQKVFAFFLQFLLTVLLLSIAEAAIQVFTKSDTAENYPALLILLLSMYLIYITLMLKFGRRFFNRLFEGGRATEWILYTVGVLFSFGVLMISRNDPGSILHYVLLLLFVLWSFAILCFSIINANEKAKSRYEAEFARDIITTGSDHYQKMNGLYDSIRILRHDYKYHLDTISELLSSENREEAGKYLADIKEQLSDTELPSYCSNSVINALLISYSEHCLRYGIQYSVKISMPAAISIPNYEMCIILGNLMENAVEACKTQAGVRKIEVAINTQGANLAIMVKNSFNGNTILDNDRLLSKKKDGGLGLRSVQAVTARHGGELMTEWDDTMFSAYVLIRV